VIGKDLMLLQLLAGVSINSHHPSTVTQEENKYINNKENCINIK
jgi:hypothetical protein